MLDELLIDWNIIILTRSDIRSNQFFVYWFFHKLLRFFSNIFEL